MPSRRPIRTALSIAGSDSGGGAGIQADLKAFARCGVHGMTAITAVTSQNTVAVEDVTPVPPEAIVGQVRAVAGDIGVDAVKIGMLGTAETIQAVVQALGHVRGVPVVLDPVMIASSGAILLDPSARETLVDLLLPLATVATPNLAEAAALSGLGEDADPGELARAVHSLGPAAVVVTGGRHASATDFFYDGERMVEIGGERFPVGDAHGSGCTHSAALAAFLALGREALEAAQGAKSLATEAVRDALRDLGAGPGPVDALGLARHRNTAGERS